MIGAYFEPPFFEWWDKDANQGRIGFQDSVDYIRQVNEEQGPFVGVSSKG